MPNRLRSLTVLFLICTLAFNSFAPAFAQQAVTFTVTAKSIRGRSAPNGTAPVVYSFFQNQTFNVLGRNEDGSWIRLQVAGPADAWVLAANGKVTGDVMTLPILPPTPYTPPSSTTGGGTSSGGPATSSGTVAVAEITIIEKSVRVRNFPSLTGAIIAQAKKDQKFTVRGRTQDALWVKIDLPGFSGEAWIWASTGKLSVRNVRELVVVTPSQPASGPAPAPSAPSVPSGPVAATPGGFELGGQVQDFRFPDLMKSAGMTWVKRQMYWSPGAGVDVGMINDAHNKGFKMLVALVADAHHMAGGTNFDAIASYAGQIAAAGADAIEVMNETNLDRSWPRGELDPARYVELLKKAYAAIKAANPNTLVISSAPSPTGAQSVFGADRVINDDNYLRGMAAAGAVNYMDCIGIHYNEGMVSPTRSSGDPRSDYYTRYYPTMVSLYYNTFGGRKKLCFTEIGYLSHEGYPPLPQQYDWGNSISVGQQAQWLAEAASLARGSNIVRLMIVWNVDFTTFDSDPQAAFGIVRPGGGCPACNTLGRVMGTQ